MGGKRTNGEVKIGVMCSRVRVEEKLLFAALQEREVDYDRMDPRINPTGGAIALGHPIGASGVIYFGEMCRHLKRTKGRAALQMICGGGGVGIACVVEAV